MSLLSKSKLKSFRSLKLKKHRDQEKKFLVEGVKFCYEALSSNVNVYAFLYCPQSIPFDKITKHLELCELNNVPCYQITPGMLNELSGTVHSQGVICVVDILSEFEDFQYCNLILTIDAIQEPGNLGTIIRSADWFGVDAIMIGKDTVDLYNSKVLRSTMGSIFHIPFKLDVDLPLILPKLKETGLIIYAADVHGTYDVNTIEIPQKKLIIVGNEVRGINPAIKPYIDYSIRIPAKGKAESLNVAIASGIILNKMVNNNA